jgi:hypothetical protein
MHFPRFSAENSAELCILGAKDKTMKGQTLSLTLSAGAAEEKSHVVNRAAL